MAWYDGLKTFINSLVPGNNAANHSANGDIAPHGHVDGSADGLDDFVDTTWSSYYVKF